MKILAVALVLCMLANLSAAFYTKNSGVISLDSNFNKEVIKSDELWLVEFYAPWCGHCQALKPEWEKAAKALKGIVKVGAVDMDAHPEIGSPYNVQGFPTIKFFGADKKTPIDYDQARDEKAIVNFALNQVNKVVKDRLKGKSSGTEKEDKKKGGSESASSDKDVVVLTDSNFNDIVYNSKDIWLIEFYAPWCGHCKKLQPNWEAAASKLKGKVNFGKVDATVEKKLAGRFQIKSYPTIKYWNYGGGKTDKNAQAYQSGREADQIVTFAQGLYNSADIDPDIFELNDQKVYDKECTSGVCVIAFLPNIYESSAVKRNEYIGKILKSSSFYVINDFFI